MCRSCVGSDSCESNQTTSLTLEVRCVSPTRVTISYQQSSSRRNDKPLIVMPESAVSLTYSRVSYITWRSSYVGFCRCARLISAEISGLLWLAKNSREVFCDSCAAQTRGLATPGDFPGLDTGDIVRLVNFDTGPSRALNLTVQKRQRCG